LLSLLGLKPEFQAEGHVFESQVISAEGRWAGPALRHILPSHRIVVIGRAGLRILLCYKWHLTVMRLYDVSVIPLDVNYLETGHLLGAERVCGRGYFCQTFVAQIG